jgi:anti-sigma factor RsiW
MNCEEAIKLMDGYLDGEFDPLTSQAIEEHLRECPDCDQVYKTQSALIRNIGDATPYYRAPAGLRERIQSSLREEMPAHPLRRVAPDAQPHFPGRESGARTVLLGIPWNWLGLAAAIIFAAIIALNFLPGSRQSGADQFLATQLIAGHVRSLMANHLADVVSSDQHTVKPWLDAKLDFAPPVIDLSGEGFPLLGGRLDYLDKRPVAALVYQRRKHFINLFVWPAEPNTNRAAKTISREGYQLLHWVDSDFNYWAVSDVSANDLQILKEQIEAQTSRR